MQGDVRRRLKGKFDHKCERPPQYSNQWYHEKIVKVRKHRLLSHFLFLSESEIMRQTKQNMSFISHKQLLRQSIREHIAPVRSFLTVLGFCSDFLL